MKKLVALLAAAFAGAFTLTAATPIAVWDGDFTTLTKGTFTLSENGNTKTDSYLQISGNNGITVTSTEALNVFTVIMRCSGLNLAAENAQVLFTSYANDTVDNNDYRNLTGVNLPANNAVCRGIWSAADWNNDEATQGSVPANYTTLIYNHQQTNGTYGYALGPTSSEDDTVVRTTLYSVVGLRSSGTTYHGFNIGGLRGTTSTTLLPATGLKITSIAVFSGTLTEAEMKAYSFPSEIQAINVSSDTYVSAINALYDSTTYKAARVTVASGLTITVDEAFSEKIQSVSSTGSITLSAESQPDASYNLANVDFSGVQGGLLRSWLTPGVVGFNFRSANGTDVSGALATADNWIHDSNSASGTSTAMFADGLSTLKWSSANTWACSGSTIISGYLDDGANGGNGATVTLSNVPYETYDVIVYCSSDSNPGQFLAKTVNDTTYTWDTVAGAVVAGNAAWGKAALSTPVYGVNALRIKNLSGPLTIYGTARNGSNRGGIAAIEIMPPNTPDNIPTYKLALNGTETTWSGGTWTLNDQTVDAPADGYVEIVASASTELTVDQAVSLTDLKVRGGENIVVNIATNDTGSLYAIRATVESGVFQQGSPAVLGATPSIVVASGATFDENGMDVNAANAVTIAGAGAGNWPWALTSSSGAGGAILGGLYLSANATIGGENELKVGQTGAGYYCYLQGFALTKTGAGAFTGTNMNTPGTGTIEVQGGAMSVNQWNNLNNNDGDTTVILNSDTSLANVTDRIVPMSALGLYGGTLSTASKAFKVNSAFRGAGETANLVFGDGASAMLTGDLTITASLTLDGSMTFLKDQEAAADVVVTPASLTASSGTITVGSGVTFNVGTSRPTATITVAEGGTLAVRMQDAADVIQLSASAQPANVILYDANGNVVSNPRISYSGGTLTIMPPVPVLEASGTVAFDTASNWVGSAMPDNNGDAIIELSDDATITVSGTYSLGSLTITGSGVVTFSGNGTITAANISVKNGATFVRGGNVSATTGIDLAAGTVLRIDGVDESAVISGAGAVETYGDVTMGGANTFTGGITAKTGILSTTVFNGFGGAKDDGSHSVTVEDGACVDISNTSDTTHSLTIAGNGVLLPGGTYSGAVRKSTGSDYGIGSRQTKSITLTADALVDLTTGWGIVRNSHNEATLALNGHTLTIRGTQTTFPMAHVNASSSTGKIVLDGVTLQVGSTYASDFTGVEIVAKGGSAVNFELAPSAIGAVTVLPTATSGVGISGYANMGEVVPVVRTSDIDASALAAGDEITLLTADADLTAGENVATEASSRYEITVSGRTVTATAVSVLSNPFLHYCFDDGAAVDTGKAADSRTQIYAFGEVGSPALFNSRNGSAVHVHTGYTAYWDTNVSGVSPFDVGEVSVTTVAKMKETGVVVWGLGNTNDNNPALGLVVLDETSASVVARNTSGTVETLVTLTGTADLTRGWHFFAVVATAGGTSLCVDGMSASSDKTVSFSIGQQGQFGSFHGGAIGAGKVGAEGYLLDDWRVYDAALTAEEIRVIRGNLAPEPLFLRLR